jgi:hypothetical protein
VSVVESELPSLVRVLRRLDAWFHEAPDPYKAAVLRIAVGALVVINYVATVPFVEMWWSEHGFLPYKASKYVIDTHTWTLFDFLPHTDAVLWTAWGLLVGQALLLTLGLFSRFQAVCVFVWLVTFNHRNGIIIDGEDIVFRLLTFFLIFLPAASDVWSLDAWLRKRRGKAALPVRDGWALRMVQIQMCIVLWSAGVEKLAGGMWWGGTAMYYVLHLDDFAFHYYVPDFVRNSLFVSRALTWASLWIEVGAPILIWFKETRRAALVAILLLHFGIEYMMNLYLFEWIMIAGWLMHGNRDDLTWLRSLALRLTGKAVPTTSAPRAA